MPQRTVSLIRAFVSVYLAVIFARSCWSFSGRYMMMPTQECTSLRSSGQAAGLMSAELLLLHLCSMGPGAGTSASSKACISSAMKSRSAPVGFLQQQVCVRSSWCKTLLCVESLSRSDACFCQLHHSQSPIRAHGYNEEHFKD